MSVAICSAAPAGSSAEPSLAKLLQRARARRPAGRPPGSDALRRAIGLGILLTELADRFGLATQPLGRVQVLPTGGRVAAGESIAGPFDHLSRDFLGKFLRRQKLAKRLASASSATRFFVAAVLARHAGFSKLQSPGGKHGWSRTSESREVESQSCEQECAGESRACVLGEASASSTYKSLL